MDVPTKVFLEPIFAEFEPWQKFKISNSSKTSQYQEPLRRFVKHPEKVNAGFN